MFNSSVAVVQLLSFAAVQLFSCAVVHLCSCAVVQLFSCAVVQVCSRAGDLGETLPLYTDLCEVDHHHGSPGHHYSLAQGQVEDGQRMILLKSDW